MEEEEEEEWGYISLDTSMDFDPEFLVINGSSTVMYITEESQISIGDILFKIYNSNLLGNFQLLDAADASTGDEEWLMSTFIEVFEEELELLNPKFLMLNMISIKPDYRNKGYGKVAIKELSKLCKLLEIDYIVLKPSPIEDVDFNGKNKAKRKKDIENLISFYDQLDFDVFILEDEEPIMVFEVNDADLLS